MTDPNTGEPMPREVLIQLAQTEALFEYHLTRDSILGDSLRRFARERAEFAATEAADTLDEWIAFLRARQVTASERTRAPGY